jgi:hypothetical protein
MEMAAIIRTTQDTAEAGESTGIVKAILAEDTRSSSGPASTSPPRQPRK